MAVATRLNAHALPMLQARAMYRSTGLSSLVLADPFSGVALIDYKRPFPKGSGEIPIPFLSEKSPTLASDNWCLIGTQDFTKGDD